MKTIKVLKLSPWMQFAYKRMLNTLKETTPIFNRNGFYLLEDKCWFEVDSRAFEYEKSSFQYDLRKLSHKRLRDVEYQHMKELIKVGFKSSEISIKLSLEEQLRSDRKTKIHRRKILREVKKK